jgi:hypothetical protein
MGCLAVCSQVYFVWEPARNDGGVGVALWESEREAFHRFDLEDTWDWWQDWHLCLVRTQAIFAFNERICALCLVRTQTPAQSGHSQSSI